VSSLAPEQPEPESSGGSPENGGLTPAERIQERRAKLDRRVEPRWELMDQSTPEEIESLRASLDISPVMARILLNRGIRTLEQATLFLEPALDHLIDPFIMMDMDRAVERIWQALDAGERILIHGDYDVDGVTGTSVLVLVLKALGADVLFTIPNRLEQGYGISREALEKGVAQGVSLLISVDCGITAVDEVAYAQTLGLDVIVTDHHEPTELPKAVAVVNPKRPDCPYPFLDLPGVALAFKLADALHRARSLDTGPVYRHLDLVALGCAADIVSLVGENRVLVTFGLRQMEATENLGLRVLMRNLHLTGRRLGTGQLIFVVAPRINALGRLGSAIEAVTLLTTEDEDEAQRISELLEQQNRLRREIDERTHAEALEMVAGSVDLERDRAVVLASEQWHPGVIGIVASRIAEQVNLPTVLISAENDPARGSARSIPGFDLYGALTGCQEHLDGFGGHTYAAGLWIRRDQIQPFRDAFLKAAELTLRSQDMVPTLNIDAELTLDQIDAKLMEMLKRFAPFGPQNARLLIVSRGVDVVAGPMHVGKNHIKFKARQNGRVLDCIAYDMGHLDYRLSPGEANLDMAYVIEETDWRGRRGVQLRIRDMR